MRATRIISALLGICILIPTSRAEDKKDQPDDALLKSLKEADVIFTGTIDKVSPLGQTNSIPPSTFGEIKFKNTKALRGSIPEGKLNYSFREGKKNFDLDAKGDVIVALQKTGVTVIVPANDANLALAKKIAEEKKQPEK